VITWESANDSIATVDTNGRVTGQAKGTVIITARSEGEFGEAQVDVADPATYVVIDPDSVSIGIGQQVPLEAKPMGFKDNEVDEPITSWESSSGSIATVLDGEVTGIAPGKVTITAKSGETAEGSATVVVLGPPNAIQFDGEFVVDVTSNTTLSATVVDVN